MWTCGGGAVCRGRVGCTTAGFETRGPEELPALREVVRARFGPELAFLEAMPEILLTPDYLFVHGGVADEAHLEGLDAWKCMKNDDFLSQGHSFRRGAGR